MIYADPKYPNGYDNGTETMAKYEVNFAQSTKP